MHLCVSSSVGRQRQAFDITRDSSYSVTIIAPDKLATQAAGKLLGQIVFSTIHKRPYTRLFPFSNAIGHFNWALDSGFRGYKNKASRRKAQREGQGFRGPGVLGSGFRG